MSTQPDEAEEGFLEQSDACMNKLFEALEGTCAFVVTRTVAKAVPVLIYNINLEDPSMTKDRLWRAVLHTMHKHDDDFRDAIIEFLEETHGQ